MRTYKVYMLRKIMVVNYFILFFVLAIVTAILLHRLVHENNIAVLLFMASIIIEGLFCYYLSLAVSITPVSLTIDDANLGIDHADERIPRQIPVNDIIEYELVTRSVAPKDILVLHFSEQRKIKLVSKQPWSGRSRDFDALVSYFEHRPQVRVNERPSDLPTAE